MDAHQEQDTSGLRVADACAGVASAAMPSQDDSWEGFVDGAEENDRILMAIEEEQEEHGVWPLHFERSRMAQANRKRGCSPNHEERIVRTRMAMHCEDEDEADILRREWWDMFCEDKDVGGGEVCTAGHFGKP